MGDGWKRRFFVLSSRQEQTGEDLDVQYYLHYFKSEDQVQQQSIFRLECSPEYLSFRM